jgi:hypothetical protein
MVLFGPGVFENHCKAAKLIMLTVMEALSLNILVHSIGRQAVALVTET